MSFSMQGFDAHASGSGGGLKLHTYISSADNLATVEGAGYFNTIASVVSTGDILFCKASNGTRIYQLTNTAGVITFTTLTDGTNDAVFA